MKKYKVFMSEYTLTDEVTQEATEETTLKRTFWTCKQAEKWIVDVMDRLLDTGWKDMGLPNFLVLRKDNRIIDFCTIHN